MKLQSPYELMCICELIYDASKRLAQNFLEIWLLRFRTIENVKIACLRIFYHYAEVIERTSRAIYYKVRYHFVWWIKQWNSNSRHIRDSRTGPRSWTVQNPIWGKDIQNRSSTYQTPFDWATLLNLRCHFGHPAPWNIVYPLSVNPEKKNQNAGPSPRSFYGKKSRARHCIILYMFPCFGNFFQKSRSVMVPKIHG